MEKPLVFVDLDFTLTRFDDEAARNAVREKHGQHIHDCLYAYFLQMLRIARGVGSEADIAASEALRGFIKDATHFAGGKVPEDIFWSREGVIRYRFSHLTPQAVSAVADTYWNTIGASGLLYPDARALLEKLKHYSYEVFCVTASDGRMHYDYDKDLWVYDPLISMELKKDRVGLGELYSLLPRDYMIVAEPHPKSSKECWQKLESRFGRFDSTVWMIGDSYASDIVAVKTHAPCVQTVLVDREKKISDRARYPLADYVVNDLSEAVPLILGTK